MKILAIETSHDDTSVSLYENREIIKEITISQTEFHKKFGGTLPEYASRHHAETIVKILKLFLEEFDLNEIDRVAYTEKPGLIGSLHVGSLFAHAIGFSLNKPVIGMNHMHGHIFASLFDNEIIYPAIALIVSGGHTQLWYLTSPKPSDIKLLGGTKDDAVGEVFDKVARRLKLGFPGGPIIDKLAKKGNPIYDFGIKNDDTYDFSFSGFKTKVINFIHNREQSDKEINLNDISRSFQDYIFKPLLIKTKKAIAEFNPKSIILGGGVSANSQLRDEFKKLHQNSLIPSMKYTTDNASMIAIASHVQKP
ncbi:MAG: tRNA (adenosine(37)-N6)-threonylcarbamoyltransferase complex transferase subunit TsaD [Mycoplasmatales bacterium]|nr:tRNA (adenosine(37)-N6)-threonylcarbamoyltransferase complex transferase subunit TsaD [Mycoplasmatales bacterium]